MGVLRRGKLKYLRVIALLSIIRWYNVLLIMLAQYLLAVFVFNDPSDYQNTISNFDLHLMIFASAFLIAAGFIINNFYDLEKDLINRPKSTLFQRLAEKGQTLNFYIFFNVVGLLMAIYASLNIFIYFFAFAVLLWFYSHKVQKLPGLREFSATLLMLAPLFSIAIYYHHWDAILLLYGAFFTMIILTREIIKEFQAMQGDLIYGYKTLVVAISLRKAKLICLALCILAAIPPLMYYLEFGWDELLYSMLGIYSLVFFATMVLMQVSKKPGYKMVNDMYKIAIGLGILAIYLIDLK